MASGDLGLFQILGHQVLNRPSGDRLPGLLGDPTGKEIIVGGGLDGALLPPDGVPS
jgi:hypothetical protein